MPIWPDNYLFCNHLNIHNNNEDGRSTRICMKKLLRFLRDYKKESILGPLFKMLEASFELLIPVIMAYIIDVGIAAGNKRVILFMGGLMVLFGIVGLICSITAQYYAAKAAVGFSTSLRHELFTHIQGLSYSELDGIGTSTLITRMTSDINQVQSGVNLVLRLFLRSPFIVFGAMFMAFTIDVKAAMIFVITIPLLSVVVFGVMLVSIPLYKKVQKGLDKVLGITRQNLTGVRVIRAFHMEEEEIGRFDESNETLTRLQLFVGRISALMNPVTYVIINCAVAALIWSGALRVEAGIITQGAVVALISYMSQILAELIKLANLIITVTKAIACGNRVQSVFEIKSNMKDGEGKEKAITEDENMVVFDQVSFTYQGAGEESLSNISFTAKKGQTIGIIGGTGSGKSSLINLIPRFYDASSGRVLIKGRNVKDYAVDELRDKIGIVPQKAVLFKGTIEENLKWGKESASREELYEALAISQASEFVDAREDGLSAMIHQGGKNLSGGQKQRLTIARALVKKPDILILDDSASALDFATDAKLRRALREMNKDTTVFIVSQRASSIQHADQIIVLDDGRMEGIGTHEELLMGCPVYEEIYASQFERKDERHPQAVG